jgi:hypothetical protein
VGRKPSATEGRFQVVNLRARVALQPTACMR